MGKVAVCLQLSLSTAPVSSISGAGTALQSCSHEWVSTWNYIIWGLLLKNRYDHECKVGTELERGPWAPAPSSAPLPTSPREVQRQCSYYVYFKPGEGRAVASFMPLCHRACAWLYFPSTADTSAAPSGQENLFCVLTAWWPWARLRGECPASRMCPEAAESDLCQRKKECPKVHLSWDQGEWLDCAEP